VVQWALRVGHKDCEVVQWALRVGHKRSAHVLKQQETSHQNYTLPNYTLPNYKLPNYTLPNYKLPNYTLPNYKLPNYMLPTHFCIYPIGLSLWFNVSSQCNAVTANSGVHEETFNTVTSVLVTVN
jgi:hypothetical protein